MLGEKGFSAFLTIAVGFRLYKVCQRSVSSARLLVVVVVVVQATSVASSTLPLLAATAVIHTAIYRYLVLLLHRVFVLVQGLTKGDDCRPRLCGPGIPRNSDVLAATPKDKRCAPNPDSWPAKDSDVRQCDSVARAGYAWDFSAKVLYLRGFKFPTQSQNSSAMNMGSERALSWRLLGRLSWGV